MTKTVKAEKKDFESQLTRLQSVVDQLEQDDISLERSLVLFKEGQELVKDCRKRLATARHQVEVFSQGALSPLNLNGHSKNDEL
jgi:exodeoxyribonuclease VII small subunit